MRNKAAPADKKPRPETVWTGLGIGISAPGLPRMGRHSGNTQVSSLAAFLVST